MPYTTTKTITADTIPITTHEVHRLFIMSTQLADFAEDILERRAEYRKEFLRGLKKSLHEAHHEKRIRLQSVLELQ